MKKRIKISKLILQVNLLIASLLFAVALQSQSPGGIGTSNIKLWLRADKITAADGAALSTWTSAVNNYSVSNYGVAKNFYNSTENYLINFNPSVWFRTSGDLRNNARLFSNTSAFTIITVGKETATNKGTYRGTAGFGSNGNYPAIDLASRKSGSGYQTCWGPYFDFSGGELFGSRSITYNGIWPGSGQQPQIYSVSSANASTSGSAIYTHVDNYKELTNRRANQSFQIGNGTFVGSSYDANWTGSVNEVLVFDRVLTDDEMQKVNTYLAIKYGITLRGQNGANATAAGASNYIDSDGSVVWNITHNSLFNYNIAGIGRDDASELMQKQSRSVNSNTNNSDPMKNGDMLAIGLNSIAVSNSANSGTFANNKQFFMWGDNGKSGLQSTDVPTSATLYGIADKLPQRLKKVWMVQNTGGVSNLQLKFYLPNTGMAGSTVEDFKLLISNTSSFVGVVAPNIISPASYDPAKKELIFDNITLADGQYFTLVTKAVYAPGGVADQLTAWYRTDDPKITQADGANISSSGNATPTSGATIWPEFNGGAPLYNGTGSKTYHKTSSDNLINFNPSFKFGGSGTGLVNDNTDRYISNTSAYQIITVGRDEGVPGVLRATGSLGHNGVALDLHTDGIAPNGFNYWFEGAYLGFEYGGGYALPYNNSTYGTYFGKIPQIYGAGSYNASASTTASDNLIYVNLDNYNQQTNKHTLQSAFLKYGLYIGSSWNDAPWTGVIGEAILFSKKLSATDLLKVNTYLAIKYGITLRDSVKNPITSGTLNGHHANSALSITLNNTTNASLVSFTPSPYMASNGNIIWDTLKNANYNFNIAGIGKDDASVLEQKQSRSQNNISSTSYGANTTNKAINGFFKGNMLTIGLGTIANSNAQNTTDFISDGDYTIWGDDGLNPKPTTNNLPAEFANCSGYRLGRQWKAQVTGNAYNNLTLQFDLNNIGGTPSTLSSNYGEMKVIVDEDGDGDFTTGSIRSYSVASLTGNIVTANNIMLQDGEIFTLVTKDVQEGIVYLVPSNQVVTNYIKCLTGSGWKYIYESTNPGPDKHKVFAFNPNGNLNPGGFVSAGNNSTFIVTIDASVTASSEADKAMTVLAKRLIQVTDNSDASYKPYTINGGVRVRIYYDPQELTNANTEISNFAASKTGSANFVNSWFKAEGDINAVKGAVKPTGFNPSLTVQYLTPDSSGIEDGVDFVEFWNIDKFSTFGYMAKATFKLNLNGRVWTDANGDIAQNDVDRTLPTLYVAVVDKSQSGSPVLAYTEVNPDGTYALDETLDHEVSYDVILTKTEPVIGSSSPNELLPDNYIATGVRTGIPTTIASVSKSSFTTASVDPTNYDFGIEQRPTTDPHERLDIDPDLYTETIPGYKGIYMNTASLPSLSGSDPEDCSISPYCSVGSNFKIVSIDASTILYYNGVQVSAGQTINNFDPSKMVIYGTFGSTQQSFTYSLVDNAGVTSANPATYIIGGSTPLPVTLEGYKLQVVNCNKVLVKWEITDAKDFSHFEIQRSSNGKDYTTIASIGFNDKQANYDYTDQDLINGEYQYRIKMVDLNGSYKISSVEKTIINCNTNEITVFPTLTTNDISVKGLQGTATVRIFAVNGRLVFEKTNVSNFEKLNISHFAAGTYTVQIIQNKMLMKTTQIIKHN